MRRFLFIGSIALVLLGFVSATAFASSTVAFTWTVTDLGQGCWGGGSLNVDGTVGGSATCSFFNGQIIEKLVPVSWSPAGPGLIELCANAVVLKGSAPSGQECLFVPVTGGPVKFTFPGGDNQTLVRVTPVSR